LIAPPLAELLHLDDAGFRAKFSGSAIKRIGHERFIRNCLIAAGNSGDATLRPIIAQHQTSASPVIAEAATWAQGQFT
jgi:epoxyqueuosine reductase